MMPAVSLARHAMATRFELVLHGENSARLRAAGEEALDEIERLDARLSLFRSGSEISQLNARAATEAVRVSPEVFALLERTKRLHSETGGAFDVTIAPLMRCWGFRDGHGRPPDAGELADAKSKVGMDLVHLDAADFTVRFERSGVSLDLGAIGKGYAVEKAAEILREVGVTSALIHGGTSTIGAIGAPPDAAGWTVAIEKPPGERSQSAATTAVLAKVLLRDESLSVSAVWGKSFQSGGMTFGHVLDPRRGEPVAGALLAAVALPSATETDALSTALLVSGRAWLATLARRRPGARAWLVLETPDGFEALAHGDAAAEEAR